MDDQKPKWLPWLALLLLPAAFFLPILGSNIQSSKIGPEHLCCMLFTDPEYVAIAERAKSLHWLSDLIIGSSILLAIAILFIGVYILYRYAIKTITIKSWRIVAKVIIGIAAICVVIPLFCAMMFFTLDNNGLYAVRFQPPDNGIYGESFRYIRGA